ncbi:hypothetical protein [Streptomyces sp. NPDC051909]|uniref:hypothetical protein n=1 Tax=Streptomyces sp. NPDC051909 TaxID=3154944 RepID=UPI00341F0193
MVGIVIPVAGIVVTLMAGGRGEPSASESPKASASEKGAQPTKAPGSGTSPGTGAGATGEAPPKVRFSGEVRVELGGGGERVDLDTTPPLVGQIFNGADIVVGATTGSPTLDSPGSDMTLAPLPGSGPVPSEAECAEAVERNGTYTTYLSRGARLCVQTKDGRTAYLRTIAAPTDGPVRLAVTVWEQPN